MRAASASKGAFTILGIAAIAGAGLVGGYFLTGGSETNRTVADRSTASTSTASGPSIEVVRVKVMKGSVLSPATTQATGDVAGGDAASAEQPPPAFAVAFTPPGDTGSAPSTVADDQSTSPASTDVLTPADLVDAASRRAAENPSTAPASSDVLTPADLVDAASRRASAADLAAKASLAGDAASAPVEPGPDVAADTNRTPPPADPPADVVAVAAPQPEPETVAPAGKVVASPSFSCHLAQSDTELAICNDPMLAAKDRQLARIYRQVRASLRGASRVSAKKREREWLKERDSCGASKICVLSAYSRRISELKSQLD